MARTTLVDFGYTPEALLNNSRWDHFALACADRVRQIFVRDPDSYDVEINDAMR